jgi:hypothetical protein
MENELSNQDFTVVSEVSSVDQRWLTRITQTIVNFAGETITKIFIDDVEQPPEPQ